MKWYSIKAFTFPSSWAALVIAFILVALYLRFFVDRKLYDWYENAVFLFIIVWKLSVIIFQFSLSMRNLFNILYFDGGIRGYWLGLASALLYTLYKTIKSDVNVRLCLKTCVATIFIYEWFFTILNGEHFFFMIIQSMIGGVFLYLFKKKQTVLWHMQLLILFTCSQGLYYSLKNDVLSVPMLTYVIVAIFFSVRVKMEGNN